MIPILLDDDPGAVQIRKAVYGDRPFGLPWQVVHALTFALICAPFPIWLVSFVRLQWGSREINRPVSGFLSFLANRRALMRVPKLCPHARRVEIITLGYLLLFMGWIVFTSMKGI
jgi:hypothetical protein